MSINALATIERNIKKIRCHRKKTLTDDKSERKKGSQKEDTDITSIYNELQF